MSEEDFRSDRDEVEYLRSEPPISLIAEQYVLSAMLQSAGAIEEVIEVVEPADFYRPGHKMLFETMVMMWACGDPVDTITVVEQLRREKLMRSLGGDGEGPMYVSHLFGLPVVTASVTVHAAIVREKSVRRKIGEIATRLRQRSFMPEVSVPDLLAEAEHQTRELGRLTQQAGSDTPMSVAEFTARQWDRLPPVLPGLLDQEDRAVCVGFEGSGKTTLALQLATGAAAGVHPFAHTTVPQKRVLLVDLENPRSHVYRQLRKFQALGGRYGWDASNMIVWCRPAGIDLKRPGDQARLAAVIRHADPKLVIAGPIYKMITNAGENPEHLHSIVTHFWDTMRERFGFALWLETHPPGNKDKGKRDLTPIGSTIYMRWPEFGFAMQPDPKRQGSMILGRFRGDRPEGRVWPVRLERNRMPQPCWPWTPVYEDGTLTFVEDSYEEPA